MYLTCENLPDVAKLSDMNIFIFLWSLEDEEDVNMELVVKKNEVVQYVRVLAYFSSL